VLEAIGARMNGMTAGNRADDFHNWYIVDSQLEEMRRMVKKRLKAVEKREAEERKALNKTTPITRGHVLRSDPNDPIRLIDLDKRRDE